MLRVMNNGSKAFIVTLQEKAVGLNPFYTWKLTDKQTLDEYYFCNENFSNSPYFDAFTVSIGQGSATAGYVDCGYGQFTYEIYQTSQYALTVTTSDPLVETGILMVGATFANTVAATASTTTIKVNKNNDRI